MGKAIYQPKGKAQEYSQWACNLFKGCKGKCTYCYLKKGILANVLGGEVPKLKECFKDQNHAKKIFHTELIKFDSELQKHGLFFSFTSDFFPETKNLLIYCVDLALLKNIPVKILTKQTDWLTTELMDCYTGSNIAFGFTLTGHDEDEPGCSSNQSRIYHMMQCKTFYFKTFASIEPIIDFQSSLDMIKQSNYFCDLYKIGLMSGKKYDKHELRRFMDICQQHIKGKIYFKDSLLKVAGVERFELPTNCVTRDYNLFK